MKKETGSRKHQKHHPIGFGIVITCSCGWQSIARPNFGFIDPTQLGLGGYGYMQKSALTNAWGEWHRHWNRCPARPSKGRRAT